MLYHRFRIALLCLTIALIGAGPQRQAFAQSDTSTETSEQDVTQVKAESNPVSAVNLKPIFAGTETPALIHLQPMQEHFITLVEKVRPATVGIVANGASGSGVIVSRDGFVLTAAHVISQPNVVATVILQDGTELKAITLGMNHDIDSGLLKITDDGKWPYLDMGESEPLKEGQWVMAIGHPGGFDGDRAPPIRVGRVISNSASVIQTDCTLVGGDSGGPLVDMQGDVIGIHSRIGGFLNQNYHVPVDTYLVNWDDLANKVVTGGGVTAVPVKIGFTIEGDSMIVTAVAKNGPAQKARI
ncbi:MAG TPA: trypsin-like peptidase domain-containing protein [Pirellulaceae bacterium]|nr:trypsin-like peptidase domain-containing protein [Pirellulaceae bacterium]